MEILHAVKPTHGGMGYLISLDNGAFVFFLIFVAEKVSTFFSFIKIQKSIHMTMLKEMFDQMHAEHAQWQSRIKELKAELQKCNDQLAEMVRSGPESDLLVQIEQFQNQFTVQREVLDIMRHDFKQHENAIEAHQRGEINRPDKLNELHIKNKERLKDYEKIFSDLKHEFTCFLQKNFASQY
jgi:hypothetical protein